MARLLKLLAGVALAGLAVKHKDKVAGLLGGGSGATGGPVAAPGPAPAPAPANVDVAGPPANTATAVPAPDPLVHDPLGGIDEQAEEEAAAAEAANIGGPAPTYPDPIGDDVPADPALAPVEEAGGGVSEGEELAEADLAENAEALAGDPIEAERQIDEVIEAQDDPSSGEQLSGEALSEPVSAEELPPPPSGPPVDLAPPPVPDPPADDKSTAVWKSEEQPTVDIPKVKPEDERS